MGIKPKVKVEVTEKQYLVLEKKSSHRLVMLLEYLKIIP